MFFSFQRQLLVGKHPWWRYRITHWNLYRHLPNSLSLAPPCWEYLAEWSLRHQRRLWHLLPTEWLRWWGNVGQMRGCWVSGANKTIQEVRSVPESAPKLETPIFRKQKSKTILSILPCFHYEVIQKKSLNIIDVSILHKFNLAHHDCS